MKSETIEVGTKKLGGKIAVECLVKIPETVAECQELAKSDEFVVRMFKRAWRIWLQENSGARDFIESSSEADRKDDKAFAKSVQEIIDSADPSSPPSRAGRVKGPKVVNLGSKDLKAAMSNPEKLAELLAAQGIKLTIES